jgi:hypothetical protein
LSLLPSPVSFLGLMPSPCPPFLLVYLCRGPASLTTSLPPMCSHPRPSSTLPPPHPLKFTQARPQRPAPPPRTSRRPRRSCRSPAPTATAAPLTPSRTSSGARSPTSAE